MSNGTDDPRGLRPQDSLENPQDPLVPSAPPPPPPMQTPGPMPPLGPQPGEGKALASMILGIVVGVVGLILAINAQNLGANGKATAGKVMSIITIVLSVLNGVFGAILNVTNPDWFQNLGQ